jgi:tripartite-type tricarboxylate transporter receptor subunit TctC
MMFFIRLKSQSSWLHRLASPVLALAFLLLCTAVQAQNYPNKKISFMVPWPAGGLNDMVGRAISNELQTSLGQPVIVENLVGAGGSIGTSKALQAPASPR